MGRKDVVSKQVIKHIATDIARILLNLDIDEQQTELLGTEQQRVELRQADLVSRMQFRKSHKSFILHVEIQNSNDKQMPLRMLRYYTDIQFAYPGETIYQYLIYIGKDALLMPDKLVNKSLQYHYHILDMHQVDCQLLLEQDNPDALVLAILCDFREKPVQSVVNYIVKRLKVLLKDDEQQFCNYFEMLETLSENRHLQQQLSEAKAMLTKIDIEKLPSFNWGVEQGIEQGIEKGIEKGIYKVARNMLDVMDDRQIAKLTELPLSEIQALRQQKQASH